MSDDYAGEPLLDMFVFETEQNLGQLEQIVINNESRREYSGDSINEIFRIMHTIKGSAAMMSFHEISALAHKVEDLFYFIRDRQIVISDDPEVPNLVLESVDFIKSALKKIKDGEPPEDEAGELSDKIERRLDEIKKKCGVPEKPKAGAPKPGDAGEARPGAASAAPEGASSYKALILFEEGCQMESIRAFDIVYKLQQFASGVHYVPEDIADSDDSSALIREKGFIVFFSTDRGEEEIRAFFQKTLFVRELRLEKQGPEKHDEHRAAAAPPTSAELSSPALISVSVAKLDKLMNLIGEMVISQALVLHNPDLRGLSLNNFQKSAQQLKKITGEMQDTIMSIRMVSLSTAFAKANRIVRDMSKRCGKDIRLKMIGEDTEVDKNIIERISDPLVHLVRNCIDHGIESAADRERAGKPPEGTITLEARNEGRDVLVIVEDDGRGLNREKILEKARRKGLLTKPESEMSDREVFSLIFLPGFSTKEQVTEFSGRGVGMDIVVQNIDGIGGRVVVSSTPGRGTKIIMKMPVTLAIIEGMNVKVGGSIYTIPITDIKESFRPKPGEAFCDPERNEMIMVRGNCYPIIRLHRLFHTDSEAQDLQEGILIMAESGDKTVCLFADELLGQQEVVVKAMPKYIKKIGGLSGCTLMGDGQISLILDIRGIVSMQNEAVSKPAGQ